MKDINFTIRLARSRWKKRLARKGKKTNTKVSNVHMRIFKNSLKNDQKIVNNNPSTLYVFLQEVGFLEFFNDTENHITIPEKFSIEFDNKEFKKIVGKIVYSIFNLPLKEITIDFSKCSYTDEPTIFFCNIVLMEIKQYFKELNSKLTIKDKNLKINLIKSTNSKVNGILYLYKNISDFDFKNFNFENEDFPYYNLGYLKGEKAKKHYLENKKNIYTTQIVRYINSCLGVSNHCFSPTGRNELEGIIAEILNNAEDHSPLNTYYVTSTFSLSLTEKKEDLVGVLNINVMNFGYSFYDGLYDNREQNSDIYNALQVRSQNDNFSQFREEEVFTLLALQDGISRLKYEDESRGTGTMKFINCFMNIGDYEDASKNFIPYLKIFSGNTLLICDKKYKPYLRGKRFCLSLNAENDLDAKPDKNNLVNLETKFPGTMISVKVYLNEKHLETKVVKNGH